MHVAGSAGACLLVCSCMLSVCSVLWLSVDRLDSPFSCPLHQLREATDTALRMSAISDDAGSRAAAAAASARTEASDIASAQGALLEAAQIKIKELQGELIAQMEHSQMQLADQQSVIERLKAQVCPWFFV